MKSLCSPRSTGARPAYATEIHMESSGASRAAELHAARAGGARVLVVNGDRDPFGIPGALDADRVIVIPGETHALKGHRAAVIAAIDEKQLSLHDKPIMLVDIGEYWAPLRVLLDHIVVNGFARLQTRGCVHVVPSVSALMAALSKERAVSRKTEIEQL